MDIQEQHVKHVMRMLIRANAAILVICFQVVAGMGAATGAQASVLPARICISPPSRIFSHIFSRMFSVAHVRRETQMPLPPYLPSVPLPSLATLPPLPSLSSARARSLPVSQQTYSFRDPANGEATICRPDEVVSQSVAVSQFVLKQRPSRMKNVPCA